MYTDTNFKTKKELKEALASGERVGVYQPGGFFPLTPFEDQDKKTGAPIYWEVAEGPHYPRPHTWYAKCQIEQDKLGWKVIKVLS